VRHRGVAAGDPECFTSQRQAGDAAGLHQRPRVLVPDDAHVDGARGQHQFAGLLTGHGHLHRRLVRPGHDVHPAGDGVIAGIPVLKVEAVRTVVDAGLNVVVHCFGERLTVRPLPVRVLAVGGIKWPKSVTLVLDRPFRVGPHDLELGQELRADGPLGDSAVRVPTSTPNTMRAGLKQSPSLKEDPLTRQKTRGAERTSTPRPLRGGSWQTSSPGSRSGSARSSVSARRLRCRSSSGRVGNRTGRSR
jgi:hypothetical protein